MQAETQVGRCTSSLTVAQYQTKTINSRYFCITPIVTLHGVQSLETFGATAIKEIPCISLPRSQQPATCPHTKPDNSTPRTPNRHF